MRDVNYVIKVLTNPDATEKQIIREIKIHIMAKEYESKTGKSSNIMIAEEFGYNEKYQICIKLNRMDETLLDRLED